MSQYMCSFCLEVTTSDGTPTVCQHCKVTRCAECGTFCKMRKLEDSGGMCHGCGSFPEFRMTFSRTGSLGSCYVKQEWERRNSSTGDEFVVMWGWKDGEEDKIKSKKTWHICKRLDKSYEFVRELTEEEIDWFRG